MLLIHWLALALALLGVGVDNAALTLSGSLVAVASGGWYVRQQLRSLLQDLSAPWLVWLGIGGSLGILVWVLWLRGAVESWDWQVVGALGETLGAMGQILIAILAAYIAWRQYIISKDLTTQQNLITQQQTIDAYFQGISELILNPDGQLDDWPLERAIAAGRTAAILNGVDPPGRAKILRFLSTANLLSPLQRDQHLGRPILDGQGGYVRDRLKGIRVIWLEAMLERTDLRHTQLRGLDLSDISLCQAYLQGADLSYVNFVGSDLRSAQCQGANFYRVLLFSGDVATATPIQSLHLSPQGKGNFKTGAGTGARVEGINCQGISGLSEENRQYLCMWGGSLTRATIPGGCAGIPDRTAELKTG
ncbi:MAG: pentapeptide repeat-containing protein [Thermostichales cyanobacterium DRC_bins_46]